MLCDMFHKRMKVLLPLLSILLPAVCVDAFAAPVKPNAKLPMVDLHYGFPPDLVNIAEYTAGKNMFILGLPGAFTPTCSSIQVPGYLKNQDALKDSGIDAVVVYSVNDGAVMNAWAKDQGIQGSNLIFFGDPTGEFTEALGMKITHPGPASKGLIARCKRFCMYVENSVVKHVAVSESEDDPAGDADPSATLCEAMLDAVKSLTPA
jgi:peroxiredoxin